MTTRLIIARHGNTFLPGQTPTRVGGKTDLDLTESVRASAIGTYLKQQNIIPDVIFAAPLKRTMQTATFACEKLGINPDLIIKDESFREIDYGPDENKTEDEVLLRLGNGDIEKGQKIIDDWNKNATVPDGWDVNPKLYIDTWLKWGKIATEQYKDKNILIVSSNGVIRFAPYLTGDFNAFTQNHDIKVTTGGLCLFENNNGHTNWKCTHWDLRPIYG